jgi:ribonucleoside-diphosphate reductase alpha chain
MADDPFEIDLSRHVWDTKYRLREGEAVRDRTVEDTWQRVARAIASVEPKDPETWQRRFFEILKGFQFLPGGRILAGAGTPHRVTLFNCFVMGPIDDSLDGIFDSLKQAALTMQQGGGVGMDFSTLRPRDAPAKRVGGVASGPVSFMQIWDAMCATLLSTGRRRGAMMATLRCDHPDIEAFVDAKRDARALRHFNLSVLVSDDFMQTVKDDRDWALVFPAQADTGPLGATVSRTWSNQPQAVPCRVYKKIRARELWEKIMRATFDVAEPGVLFIDRINRTNNLYYREQLSATNPCGELPLPAFGACDLGSLNLTAFVHQPFTAAARFDFNKLREVTKTATRLMDNVIDLSKFPLEAQANQAHGTRRVGLGLTGLSNTLTMLGLSYDAPNAREFASHAMQTICETAYQTSVLLAKEKGAFPFFEKEKYLNSEFIRALPTALQRDIETHGIRNSHLTAIAPTGTISLLANNVSSGIEPVYDFCVTRRFFEAEGKFYEHEVTDYAFRLWRKLNGPAKLPAAFVRATDLPPSAHLAMQAALQPFVDGSISKTINVPKSTTFGEFQAIYTQAHALNLKGCTTFRPNPVTGSVLESVTDAVEGPLCCNVEREAD